MTTFSDVGNGHLDRKCCARWPTLCIDTLCRRERREPEGVMQICNWPKITEVKNCTQVDEERLGALAGKDNASATNGVHRLAC